MQNYVLCQKYISQKIDSAALLWHLHLTLHWVCHFLHSYVFWGTAVVVLKTKVVIARKTNFHIKNSQHGENCHNKLDQLFLRLPFFHRHADNKKIQWSENKNKQRIQCQGNEREIEIQGLCNTTYYRIIPYVYASAL